MQEPETTSPPVVSELECPTCGTVAINRDFCTCGEYLSWELTLTPSTDAPPAPQAIVPPAPPAARASTLLTLRDPARDDEEPGATVSLTVEPGLEVALLATVRNQGQIVDTYDLRVDGLPGGWTTLSPGTVFLNPWGSAGDYQQELQVRLHPPRTPQAEARTWPLTVVARSRSLDADVAWAQVSLTIQPFQSTVMHVGPERRSSRRHASFDVAVANQGNSPMEIVIGAQDSEARCPVTIYPERTLVPVGLAAAAVVRVAVPRPLIFGRPVDHHLDVTHAVTGVESEPTPRRVTFRQRPWLPWWVPPVFALAAAFLTVLALMHRHATVPHLKSDTVSEALVVLKKRHLKLGKTLYAPAPKGVDLNTIIDQQPAAGDDLAKGEKVNITLAAKSPTGAVPPVNGLTLAKAADALKAAHFEYNPQPSSAGNDWIVIRQDPTPGTERALHTPVTLAVQAPVLATPTPTPTATATPTPTPTPKPGGASAAKAAAAGGAAAAAAKAKAATPPALVFASATTGQLLSWTKGKSAPLTAAGPRLATPAKSDDGYVAVEAGQLVHVSRDGKTINPIATRAYDHPAFSSARRLLAAIATDTGRLCVMDPQDSRTATCAHGRFAAPAWAPNGRSLLVLGAGGVRTFAASGAHASSWAAPALAYRAAGIVSAAWAGNNRIAVLVARRAGAPARLRVLARRGTRFVAVKDYPSLTGWELAGAGQFVALRRGSTQDGDGALVLLDLDRAQPRVRNLPSGVNPAWG